MKLVAKTMHGLEDILAQEIQNLGGTEIKKLKRAVAFQGDKELLYRSNYELRTALRVLKPIYTFQARSERQLYHKIHTYNWSIHFNENQTFAISSNVYSQFFNHSQYVALKAKDAIVDQFRKKMGKRPSVDTIDPDITFNIHVYEDEFTISLDSSGKSLHRRGYRDSGHMAPLNEVLSAGMCLIAGYNKNIHLLDPMCGTGTNLFEAAMIAAKIPAGYYRDFEYSFMKWADFDKSLWNSIKNSADANIDKNGINIKGGDHNPSSVRMTQEVIDDLGFEKMIKVEKLPFSRNLPSIENGLIIMNPPYGERLKSEDIVSLYKMIGDTFKKNFTGWTAWVISSNFDAMKSIGLKTSKKMTLFNGPLECKFQKYVMYQGTKKLKKS